MNRLARKRDPNREKAFELFKEHNGNITNREIAKRLDVLEKTISAWKSRDKWKEKLGGVVCSTTKNIRSTTKPLKKDVRSIQQEKIINSLVEAGTYSPALDLLIELYLDAYEDYIENRDDKLRKELAKLLGQLGLDGKNKELIKKSGVLLAKGKEEEEENKDTSEADENNKLIEFRQRRKRG